MTTQSILKELINKKIISGHQAEAIRSFETNKAFSVHWELRSILFLGILLFSSGIGVLIYENIDTIGHQAIIAAIAILTIVCFWYVFRNSLPYQHSELKNTNKFASYVLLLGCTTFLALEGYLQFQYEIFGIKYGLAVLIPTILFFFSAYRFDHTGVLSMAITGLASWVGLTIAPLSVLTKNDFTDQKLVWSAIILGTLLALTGWLSDSKEIKKHFSFTYLFLGGNLALIASLIGSFRGEPQIVFQFAGLLFSVFYILTARRSQSLVFLLMGVVTAYIIVSYMLAKLLGEALAMTLATLYFTFSSIGVILFLLKYKKFLGIKR
ncbi:hypothetical protein DYBT9623_01396 [Dyadobacter sp. CECT 9623]|uniref:DUF2157 domain-containing protein n=1 Tax=Dyadobacter linearis TaxID=2823330 RepID=A0ABM8UME7_9BACT|nr:DUF2157 domain-containing protein [Dyadobacter sp. CECT 9623]CAG5068664.1 hypothetical protein DYBT9623_01396 [Dyadobacter sp. CECT 9623]